MAARKSGLIGKGIRDGKKAVKVNKSRCSVSCGIVFNNMGSFMDTVLCVHGLSTFEPQNIEHRGNPENGERLC